ncbi:MAG: two-component system response regulator GlrR [Cognaticolwellia sp.]|jgi:two-component system response regulator GlrR
MTNLNQAAVETDSKILIVDDDPSLLRLLGIRLSAAGYQIESAKNAKIALGRLESFHPQLVISDLKMECMNGMALFEQIRAKHPPYSCNHYDRSWHYS